MTIYSETCVLIPTLNESVTIGEVVTQFSNKGFENILVVDGNSSDNTRTIAEESGATVITQSKTGKGNAVKEGVKYTDCPYILLIDGDGTYRPSEAEKLLQPLYTDKYDHIIGNRKLTSEESMSQLNSIGNTIMNRMFSFGHEKDLVDILSGYRAFTKESFEHYRLKSEGFGIETELSAETVRWGDNIKIIDVSYDPRPKDSQTNLNPITDGYRILKGIYTLTIRTNPLFFFGSITMGFWTVATILFGYVIQDWVIDSIGHEIIGLMSVFLYLVGLIILLFGYVSHLIQNVHTEIYQNNKSF